MDLITRVMLFIGALCTMIFFLRQISRSRMDIDSAVLWSLFSAVLVFLSIFPDTMLYLANIFSVESPANLVFLVVIAFLIFHQFSATLKISKLEQKIAALTQRLAVEKKLDESKTDK